MIAALEHHPVADLFPMLADDELAELAEDILQRGLLQPIVLDAEGRVLDGRNRLAACERAGVEPVYVTYDGDDPDGYALAVNTQRRNLTKGQRAMLIVESGVSPQGTDAEDASKISKQMISKARVVKAYAPALVAAVISGADQLNRAYEFAQAEKTKSEGAEAQLALLRAEDAELADKVVEGELTLAGAWAERKAREAARESERRTAIANLRSVLTYLTSASIDPSALAAQYTGALDEFKQDDLDYAADTMSAIAAIKRNHDG